MGLDPISYILAKKKIPPVRSDVDFKGYRITNIGDPTEPNDAARKVYVDIASTGLGINLFLLDAADTEVTTYNQIDINIPELTEAYVETTQSAAGDYEIASWIAQADLIPVLKLGVYEFHCQAERPTGNIPVRLFFRLYERQTDGTEILIGESMVSDQIDSRRDVIISFILASDYVMASGSRLVLKLYARYESTGATTTTRVYYQGNVRSRLGIPTAKEILDTIYAAKLHAALHGLGGPDELALDASQISTGTLSLDRIPNLPRNKVTDLFTSPFWDNIPDKPSTFPPSAHTHNPNDILPQGSGSGLDADTIDGKHYSDIQATIPLDVTSSRALDTPYQNTTGKTKIVIISLYFTGSPVSGEAEFLISPDNTWRTRILISTTGVFSQGIDQHLVLYGVVPPGYYYIVETSVMDGTVSIITWVEYEIP